MAGCLEVSSSQDLLGSTIKAMIGLEMRGAS